MKNPPKVSVIIPCFNHGKYIDEAVDSILQQTYQEFEIIIIDDGSTDPFTIEKLKSYNKQKTKVIRTKNNGLPAARNKGIQLATGKYILTLDADDKFHPSFLEVAVPILDGQSSIGVVTCGLSGFGTKNPAWMPKGGGIKNFLVYNNCLVSALFRKKCWSMVKGYNEQMRKGYEDWDFWISILEKGWKIYVIRKYLFYYRIKEESMSREINKIRPELMKKLVVNHNKTYQRYLDYVISEKEKTILQILNSKTYRLGNMLLGPVRYLRDFFNSLLTIK